MVQPKKQFLYKSWGRVHAKCPSSYHGRSKAPVKALMELGREEYGKEGAGAPMLADGCEIRAYF